MKRQAAEIMTSTTATTTTTVGPNTPLLNVVELMMNQKVSAVDVVHNHKLVGTITHEHLLIVLADLLKQKRAYKEQIYEKIYDWAYHTPIGQLVTFLANVGI